MVVAILGSRDDSQVAAVSDELTDRGIEVRIWNTDNWPGETPLSFAQRTDGQQITVDSSVDRSALDAVYYRRAGFDPRTGALGEAFENNPHAVMNQIREYKGLMMSVLRSLEEHGITVVNPASSSQIHSNKPYQLSVLDDAGVPIPETLTTNDPAAVESFVESLDEVIYKPVSGGGMARAIDTQELGGDQLEKLSNSPVLFQERFEGTTLRLFVVDGAVVATGRIISDELDYRMSDHDVEAYEPAPAVADAAVTATESLGLQFSGVDVIVESDRFAVLEANPSPMFARFDAMAGTDVATHLATYLASHT